MMESELKHLLSTYSDQEGISERVCLRDLLSGVPAWPASYSSTSNRR
jgi:hypothetical protein